VALVNKVGNELSSGTETCSLFTESDRERLVAIFQTGSACFSDLAKAAKLSPATDFRFSDLSGVDFNLSDIRGFDFTSANLSQTNWNDMGSDDNISKLALMAPLAFGLP
jgi:uncharacterized protein YjbI with pentapeptide repeats